MKLITIFISSVVWLTVSFVSKGNAVPITSIPHQLTSFSTLSESWARTWGGSSSDAVHNIVVDGLDNVYVVGEFGGTVDFNPGIGTTNYTSNGGQDVFLSKFDSNGTFQWVRTWGPSDGGSESYSIAVDGSNNIYVEGDFTGTTTNFNPWDPLHPDWHTNHPGPIANFDAFLSKFDSNGNFLWARTWGGEGYDDGPGVAVDSSGNVYVAGMYASKTIDFDPAGGGASYPAHDSGFIVDVFLSKFDSNGNFQWVRTWGGQSTDDAGEIVIVDGLGNVYVAGRYASISCDFDPWGLADIHSSNGSFDSFLSKFDSNGNFLWARTWGGPGWDAAGGLAVDGSNNVYATGTFAGTVNFDPSGTTSITTNGDQDVFFSKFAANGTFQWVNTWGGSTADWGYHVEVNQAGDIYYLVGSFSNIVDFDPGTGIDNHISNGQSDAFLTKLLNPATAAVLSRYWIRLE